MSRFFQSLSRKRPPQTRSSGRRLHLEELEGRWVPSQVGGVNPNETVNTAVTPLQLATALVGPGVSVNNVTFTGAAASTGSFTFTDPTVLGFGQGILLSSGSAADVVGPNASDYTSTDFVGAGDDDLTALSGYTTYDASVLEFDFVPTANQVVFNYVFASDEYPEWVNTPYNDVFAFFVNGTNYASVRQIAGDPAASFVPVAVNNINNSNPVQDPPPVAMRPDLFRMNYVNPSGPSATDLELDGITHVLTFQAPVTPGVVNHMKLAIADASDGIYDSAVFIQAGSLVSNENPVADLSLTPETGAAPLDVTAIVEAEDPNGLALTYTINWGDGSVSSGNLDQPFDGNEKTTLVNHTYTAGGTYYVTLTVSNGSLTGTSTEDVDVIGGTSGNSAPVVTGEPVAQAVFEGDVFTFTASAVGMPEPTVQWQVSTDNGVTFVDIAGETSTTYSATAAFADNGNLYRAVFTNDADSVASDAASLTVTPLADVTPPAAPQVTLVQDTGILATDKITKVGNLALSGIEEGASVSYSVDNGATWSASFAASEGVNSVIVCQTDAAGNVSDTTAFTFTLDTVAPKLTPTFSAPNPFLVGAVGITVSGMAADAFGISWETNGVVNTASAGLKYVTCAAGDLAGNSASVDVSYVVGYKAINVTPTAGTTFKRTASIPVTFQLADAKGLISDTVAASLASNIKVSFDNTLSVSVTYNKKTHKFSATLKPSNATVGNHTLTLRLVVNGTEWMVTTVAIKLI